MKRLLRAEALAMTKRRSCSSQIWPEYWKPIIMSCLRSQESNKKIPLNKGMTNEGFAMTMGAVRVPVRGG